MLGHRIRELRRARNMDQSDLAIAVGLTQSQVSKVERGARKLSAEEALKFAQALQVSIEELYGHERNDSSDYHHPRHQCL